MALISAAFRPLVKALLPSDPGLHLRHTDCSVQVSALALLKMAMHADSGGNIEVMGILQGKIVKDTFVVLDVFALPVEGSETRVNAQAEAYEFMIDFLDSCKVSALP